MIQTKPKGGRSEASGPRSVTNVNLFPVDYRTNEIDWRKDKKSCVMFNNGKHTSEPDLAVYEGDILIGRRMDVPDAIKRKLGWGDYPNPPVMATLNGEAYLPGESKYDATSRYTSWGVARGTCAKINGMPGNPLISVQHGGLATVRNNNSTKTFLPGDFVGFTVPDFGNEDIRGDGSGTSSKSYTYPNKITPVLVPVKPKTVKEVVPLALAKLTMEGGLDEGKASTKDIQMVSSTLKVFQAFLTAAVVYMDQNNIITFNPPERHLKRPTDVYEPQQAKATMDGMAGFCEQYLSERAVDKSFVKHILPEFDPTGKLFLDEKVYGSPTSAHETNLGRKLAFKQRNMISLAVENVAEAIESSNGNIIGISMGYAPPTREFDILLQKSN